MSEIQEVKEEAKEKEPASEKEVISIFQNLRQEAQQLFGKINELENEKAEHALVIGGCSLAPNDLPTSSSGAPSHGNHEPPEFDFGFRS